MTSKTLAIWFIAAFFYAFQYFFRVIPSVLKTDLTHTFHFDSFMFGQFAGIWYIGYALAHIPVGLALDRFGPRYVMPICLLICILGLSPLILSVDPLYPIIGRFICGIGSTGATLGMFKIVEITFKENQFAKMISLSCIIGVLGAMLSAGPFMFYLVQTYSSQNILISLILVGLILFLLMIIILPKTEKVKQESPLIILKTLLKNKGLWIISLGSGFLAGPLEGYADAWAMHSLVTIYNIVESTASHASFIIFFGFIFGLLCISPIIKIFGHDRAVILQSLTMFVAFCLILSGILPFYLIVFMLFVLGFCSAYQVLTIERTIRLFKHQMTGLATAIFNMIMMTFGSFFHTIIGTSMRHFTKYDALNTPICDITTYQYGLSIIPLMLLVGTGLFIYVQKKV